MHQEDEIPLSISEVIAENNPLILGLTVESSIATGNNTPETFVHVSKILFHKTMKYFFLFVLYTHEIFYLFVEILTKSVCSCLYFIVL